MNIVEGAEQEPFATLRSENYLSHTWGATGSWPPRVRRREKPLRRCDARTRRPRRWTTPRGAVRMIDQMAVNARSYIRPGAGPRFTRGFPSPYMAALALVRIAPSPLS